MKRISVFLLTVATAIVITACTSKRSHDVDFYYWKSKCAIGETEREYFSQLQSKRLFIRLFDVDLDNDRAVPVGPIQDFSKEQIPSDSTQVIPVVFITNPTFYRYTEEADIEKLASNISRTVEQLMKQVDVNFEEIQIDCDWTQRTKKSYFCFLEKLAELSGRRISCTLRLHQIRDKEQTGVPPVSRGSLMCYATQNPMEGDTRNSILDMELLKSYTANINDYPIDFDVILPIFSWGIVTNHLGKVKLVNGLTEADLEGPMYEKQSEGLYLVKEDGFLQSLFVNSGFTVKIETITPELLAEAKQYLDQKIEKDYSLVYFHLSEGFLRRYSIENLN